MNDAPIYRCSVTWRWRHVAGQRYIVGPEHDARATSPVMSPANRYVADLWHGDGATSLISDTSAMA